MTEQREIRRTGPECRDTATSEAEPRRRQLPNAAEALSILRIDGHEDGLNLGLWKAEPVRG